MDPLAPDWFTTHRTGPYTSQVDDGPRPRSSPSSTQAGSCTPVASARGPTQNRLRQKETKTALSRREIRNWLDKGGVTCVANRAALGWLVLSKSGLLAQGFSFSALPMWRTNLDGVETYITRDME